VNANLIKNEILELRDNGATIIFSTHRMESVEELCDHIALINLSEKILDGTKKEIKSKFKTHTYQINHKGQIPDSDMYQVVNTYTLEDDLMQSVIQLKNGSTTNQLLGALIPHVEVAAFSENIPSINDIFIQLVKGDNHE
jgi:ABC-2 type transport system ATP-binding protein